MGDIKIQDSVCIKVNDPYLQYLDVYEGQQRYQWSGENHATGIMPDDAMKYLIEKLMPGTEIKINDDESITINDNIRIRIKR